MGALAPKLDAFCCIQFHATCRLSSVPALSWQTVTLISPFTLECDSACASGSIVRRMTEAPEPTLLRAFFCPNMEAAM